MASHSTNSIAMGILLLSLTETSRKSFVSTFAHRNVSGCFNPSFETMGDVVTIRTRKVLSNRLLYRKQMVCVFSSIPISIFCFYSLKLSFHLLFLKGFIVFCLHFHVVFFSSSNL
ncbi:hypothetical protein ANCCAN_23871 [Ancylostoma caninum]|uniref:Uncharacterized protein n=1 Tax=Ancylostoma caninum TaxID=29170 RepID=A0A368FH93_ANCCA|nr:hypothetical protein ANCCAN_23871 [Ancylostoma caninum]